MRTRPPTIDGLAASTLQLPPGAWPTVLDCLCERFPAVARAQWLERMARGRVVDSAGRWLTPETPYRVGLEVHYYREVADEPPIPFDEVVLHADADLLVADKPHFLPVTPAGAHVHETLLGRLIRRNREPRAGAAAPHRSRDRRPGVVLDQPGQPRALPGAVSRATDREDTTRRSHRRCRTSNFHASVPAGSSPANRSSACRKSKARRTAKPGSTSSRAAMRTGVMH